MVKDILCFLLNGNYVPAAKGCFAFVIEMGIVKAEARCIDDAKHVIDQLIKMRISLHDVTIGLAIIERPDTMNVLVEWMQGNSP